MVVKFFAYVRDYTRKKHIDMEPCKTVEELLSILSRRYGKQFRAKVFPDNKLSDEMIILVNGRHIDHCDGVHTTLNDDDVICIIPVVAGG